MKSLGDINEQDKKQQETYNKMRGAVLLIAGRNKCGNVIHICSPFEIHECLLRRFEKEVLELLHKRVTVFWKKIPLEYGRNGMIKVEMELEFDSKYPYTEHPLQFIKLNHEIV